MKKLVSVMVISALFAAVASSAFGQSKESQFMRARDINNARLRARVKHGGKVLHGQNHGGSHKKMSHGGATGPQGTGSTGDGGPKGGSSHMTHGQSSSKSPSTAGKSKTTHKHGHKPSGG